MAEATARKRGVVSFIFYGASQDQRHTGFLGYLRDYPVVPLSIILGLLCTLGVVPYTVFLSHQTYECPWWAFECAVYTQRIGTIQGAVTLIYTVGLTCLAYACWALAETLLWPLLCLQPLTLRQIDTYLAVSRGSIPSIPLAVGSVRRWGSLLIVTCAVLATLTTLSAGPVVGYVFDQSSLASNYDGEMTVGGGTGTVFVQKNPPVSSRLAATAMYSDWYSGWATNESMPDYRYWLIDRQRLEDRGNFTAHAVRIQKSVTCSGFNLTQTTGQNNHSRQQLYFKTRMLETAIDFRGNSTTWANSDKAAVWNVAHLSVWAESITRISSNRTVAKLVFAVPGGKLEGSSRTELTGPPATRLAFISAIACDVDIELVDDILRTGDGGVLRSAKNESLPVLSDVASLYSWNNRSQAKPNDGGPYTHCELALWYAVSPIISGVSASGNQPLFNYLTNTSNLIPGGTSDGGELNVTWTLGSIHDLIDRSIGAMAQADSLAFRWRRLVMSSTVYADRMDPVRNLLLAVPVIIMISIWFMLALWTIRLHRRCELPIMKMGETAEMLKACQNELIRQQGMSGSPKLDNIRLRYQHDANGTFWLIDSECRMIANQKTFSRNAEDKSNSSKSSRILSDDLEVGLGGLKAERLADDLNVKELIKLDIVRSYTL